MKKIAFICPYFGTLPKHFPLWLNSCKSNDAIDWYLLTDDQTRYEYPQNVIVKYTTLNELRLAFQRKFDFTISLDGVYKLGDYKPLYGYLFEELLAGYDAWGHIDVADEIYGDIRKFVTDELLDKYDKLMLFGHMCIYRNTPEVNRRFTKESGLSLDYREVFSCAKFYNFEEIAKGSITRIYQHNGWAIGRLDDRIADISSLHYRFRLGRWSEDCGRFRQDPKRPLIFAWEHGKVYGYSVIGGDVNNKEYLYVHFKRRKMNIGVPPDAAEYFIVPDGFIPKSGAATAALIKQNSRGKLFYHVYFKEKKKALAARIARFRERMKTGRSGDINKK